MKKEANKCKHCGRQGHTAFTCKPRKGLKTTKPMNKIGKVAKRTNAAVAKWKASQKPNHQGYYTCYMCGAWVDYLMAEHTKSKARHPEFRTDITKLKPTCDPCNRAKGSKDN